MADIFYTCSRQEAKSLGRLALWEESHQANIRCAHEIDSLIASHTKDGQLEPDCARAALDRWGFHRVQFVLSNTLRNARAQGFDPDSLKWARIPFVPPDKTNGEFKLKSDTALLAQFVRQAHTEFQKLGLFEARHCSAELDYEGKVLILRPAVLKEEYLSPRNQLWYCEGGFGCSPTSSGRAVYATCLGDGEKTRWDRADFVGVLDEKYLPDWAAEKLSALRGPAQEQTDGPGMEMEMPQFYVIDDLWRGELNITHFDNLRDAARAYTALTAANWKALGVRDGGDAVDLIRRVPTRPRDPDGEDVM
ncbi:MAG: DUF3849 domain-containing protein, partial [Oscillospiraceae bacterium]|nr:DUF3849 domain-containing protein [Oscillospiraceae bacterium]